MSLHDETGFKTGDYKVIRRGKAEYTDEGRYIAAADVDLDVTSVNFALDRLSIPAHGLETGAGPLWVSTDDTLPAGLDSSLMYWVIKVDANTLRLATSKANAEDGIAVNFTDAGVGQLHLASYFYLSAAIYPSGGRFLSDEPEAQSTDESRTCFTSTRLFTREPGFDPDIVVIDGEEWRVDRVEYFGVISSHYRATLIRTEAP